jgi:excinuclease UvrABC nuclease subunit
MIDTVGGLRMLQYEGPYIEESLSKLTYGAYILKDARDHVIYIGSGEVVQRLWAHAPFYEGKTEETVPDAKSFKIIWCINEKEARALESKLLKDYISKNGRLPKHNQRL